MSSKAMSYGTNTLILDDATVKAIFQEWVDEQFLPFCHNISVEKVHVTRGGKFHVTLRGPKAKVKQVKILPGAVACIDPANKAASE